MTAAILAAKSAGAFLKKHFYDQKKVDEASQNDIKLELDKLSQKLITEEILSVFPTHAVLGEEGYTGDRNSEYECGRFCCPGGMRRSGNLPGAPVPWRGRWRRGARMGLNNVCRVE